MSERLRTTYSTPRVTIAAKGLLEDPPKIAEYREAVELTVNEVVRAIMDRIRSQVEASNSKNS